MSCETTAPRHCKFVAKPEAHTETGRQPQRRARLVSNWGLGWTPGGTGTACSSSQTRRFVSANEPHEQSDAVITHTHGDTRVATAKITAKYVRFRRIHPRRGAEAPIPPSRSRSPKLAAALPLPRRDAPKTIADFLVRPSKRLRPSTTPTPAASISASSLSREQRRRADTNLARARPNLRLAESKASWGAARLEELLVEETWLEALPGELREPYALELCRLVAHERLHGKVPVYPPPHLVFHVLHTNPFDSVKAVMIGQDPYHGPGQALGLAFSVSEGIEIPSSLVNIFKELHKDLGCIVPSHGNLERWAACAVREHQANSHAKKGWEQFTDAVIKTI